MSCSLCVPLLMCLSSGRLPATTMSLSEGVFGWISPQYNILRSKPAMCRRRNPSKRSLLQNVMPVSMDPDLLPPTGSRRSSTSHRSSWSSTSELEQPLSHRPGVKIDQLIKVNEAIAIELANLESGKERWLEKLKLLEARICSNIVNIDKWATENKNKHVNIQAVDVGIVSNTKIEEGSVSDVPLVWRLSLADLASIFKSPTVDRANALPSHHQRHGASPHGVELYIDEHEGTPALSRESSEHLMVIGPVDLVTSPLKEKDMSQKDIKLTSEHFSEAPGRGREVFMPSRASDVADAADIEALNDRSPIPTDFVLMPGALPELKTVRGKAGDSGGVEIVLSEELCIDGISFEPENQNQFLVGNSQTKLYDVLLQAKKQLQQLNQHAVALEKEKAHLECTLRACQSGLEEAKLDVDNLRLQNKEIQGKLTNCITSSKSAQLVWMKEKDETERKLLTNEHSVHELQQNAIVLERQNLFLQSELNHFKEAFEKEKQDALKLRKSKAAIDLDYIGCQQMLKEAQDNLVQLQKGRDTLARELIATKESLEKHQGQDMMLQKTIDELQDNLIQFKHGFDNAVEKYSVVEQERDNIQAAQKEVIIRLEKSEQHAWMLENQNNAYETLLVELKRTLEGAQEQVIALEGEKEYLKSELSESKQAFEEERQHAFSLEEDKVALEIGSCEYKQVIQERERHVLTLQNALEGTLQRADALDHQVQRLRIESKRLDENNEKRLALKREQELKCRELEAQKDVLQAELESFKSKQEAVEEALTKVNTSYASAIEGVEKEKAYNLALQHQQSLLEKENASLKMSLKIISEKLKPSDSEQERLHIKLKDTEFSLQKSIDEWDALNADHANEVAALRIQNAANECQIQELMEQVQEKTLQSEQLWQMEASLNSLAEKLHGQQSQLRSTENELETVKLELAGKKVELENEKLAKPTMIQALDASAVKLKNLERELGAVRAQQAGLRGAMKDEMVKKKELMEKLRAERAHTEELVAKMEFSEHDMLVHVEDERMAKEAALEGLEALKGHCVELDKNLQNLQAEVLLWRKVSEDSENVLQALLEERSRCKELEQALDLKTAEQEDTNIAWEDERNVNDSLLRELELERRQRVQLEEQLKMLKAMEEQTAVALQHERAALGNLKEHNDSQDARCKELETASDLARNEQQGREQETLSKRTVMQELDDQGNRSLKQDPCEGMADDKVVHAASESENLMLDVSDIIAKSKKLKQIIRTLDKESACSSSKNAIRSAMMQEVRELQSRVQGIESRLADARHTTIVEGKGKVKEEEKKNEDELLALLKESSKESSTFGQRIPGLEAHVGRDCGMSTDVARQAEEEIKRLKESTETFQQALFDAHHTAIADVVGLLVELKSLKCLLNDKCIAASDKKEEKKKTSLSLPTAALSTSALAALGLLALLKFPKNAIS
ncbi:hypothetical protein L7F22_065605 [Adiantum nelumboides]|nr:hypothetical protein [Adiantum nelumboides]